MSASTPSIVSTTGEHDQVLALDLGGSKMALAVAGRDGSLSQHARTPTASIARGEDLVEWVTEQVKAWGLTPRALGISSGGPLDDVEGTVTTWPRMEMLWGFPLVAALQRALPSLTAVRLLNDACAACAGVVLFGRGQGLKNVLYLTISTGVGGGAFIGGMLLRGNRGNVAEFGHMIVEAGGPRCDCGAHGCLEAVASASGLYSQLTAAGICEVSERGWADLGYWLKEKIETGDLQVLPYWDRALQGLATGLVNLWNCYVPQAFVIGGGLTPLVEASRAKLEGYIAERSHLMPFPYERLHFSEIAHTIPLLGAAAVAGGWIPQEV